MENTQGNELEPRVARVMKSLAPTDDEDFSCLRAVITRAHQTQHEIERGTEELIAFLSALPEELTRYFHGLVEALEIYQSIHGRPVLQDLSENTVRELRQIRDLCLAEGLRSIY